MFFSSSVHLICFLGCGTGFTLRGSIATWVFVAWTSCTTIAILWPGLHWGCRHPQPMTQLSSKQQSSLVLAAGGGGPFGDAVLGMARERGRRARQPNPESLPAGSSDHPQAGHTAWTHGEEVQWAATGVAAWGGMSFPSLPASCTEQSAVCVNGNKDKHFQPRYLTLVCLPNGFTNLLWLRLREMLLLKGENKWGCFPPSPFLSANPGTSGLPFLINKRRSFCGAC